MQEDEEEEEEAPYSSNEDLSELIVESLYAEEPLIVKPPPFQPVPWCVSGQP